MTIPRITVRTGFQKHGRPAGAPSYVPESYSYSAPGGRRSRVDMFKNPPQDRFMMQMPQHGGGRDKQVAKR